MKSLAKRSLEPLPPLLFESEFGQTVIGVDEAGRGPLAGPVCAAAVYISPDIATLDFIAELNDSKKLSAGRRAYLFKVIQSHCAYGIALTSAEEIDTLNIHHATLLAMRRAVSNLLSENKDFFPDHILVDGKFTPKNLPCAATPIVKGDSKSKAISAASILAKVYRDQIMYDLAQEFPHYGWDRNAGYGTKHHIEGLHTYGITPHHRCSFAPVKDLMDANN